MVLPVSTLICCLWVIEMKPPFNVMFFCSVLHITTFKMWPPITVYLMRVSPNSGSLVELGQTQHPHKVILRTLRRREGQYNQFTNDARVRNSGGWPQTPLAVALDVVYITQTCCYCINHKSLYFKGNLLSLAIPIPPRHYNSYPSYASNHLYLLQFSC